jgi:hypothetical protein
MRTFLKAVKCWMNLHLWTKLEGKDTCTKSWWICNHCQKEIWRDGSHNWGPLSEYGEHEVRRECKTCGTVEIGLTREGMEIARSYWT